MAIEVKCPNCNNELEADQSLYGRVLDCPVCHSSIQIKKRYVKDKESPIEGNGTNCPCCKYEVTTWDTYKILYPGAWFKCPNCKNKIQYEESFWGFQCACFIVMAVIVVAISFFRLSPIRGVLGWLIIATILTSVFQAIIADKLRRESKLISEEKGK